MPVAGPGRDGAGGIERAVRGRRRCRSCFLRVSVPSLFIVSARRGGAGQFGPIHGDTHSQVLDSGAHRGRPRRDLTHSLLPISVGKTRKRASTKEGTEYVTTFNVVLYSWLLNVQSVVPVTPVGERPSRSGSSVEGHQAASDGQ